MPSAAKKEVTKWGWSYLGLTLVRKVGVLLFLAQAKRDSVSTPPYPECEALCSPEENHKTLTLSEFFFFFPVQSFLRTPCGGWSGIYRS